MDGSIETYLLVGFALSIIGTVGGIVTFGIVLVKLPAGYFVDDPDGHSAPIAQSLLRRIGVVLKNVLGAVLVVLGLIMSVPAVPGPGIITIVLGVMLLDFAEKRRWARWVISRPPILRAVNGLRRKYGKPPFSLTPF
ncbi:MAG TPA: PGPGW domain-containing protein [Vicinamibacterales bacterium]|nr:PGPGW domain-containing protein [Vicinamibacterales bacterium]HWI16338.1 PGPGW domain-containing protein [Vicinamibacterales bacterium]